MGVRATLLVLLTACAQRAVAPISNQATTGPAKGTAQTPADNEQRQSETKLKLQLYAFAAFPNWAAAHPDRTCPDRLEELNEYMDASDTSDAWGRPIKMLCGASLPAGSKGIGVVSMGEDGKEGTDDDIKSWELGD
jgi:hypothetical protein